MPEKKITLDRYFSKKGVGSRKIAEAWILNGEVSVNGRVVTDPTRWVDPELDVVLRAEARVTHTEFHTLLLYKKRGLVTTASDEKGRPTVFDGLPDGLPHLHAVGRLDQATSGLIFLTNSNILSAYLTDPANRIPRIYLATVLGEWKQEYSYSLERGVKIDDELLRIEKCELRKKSKKESHLVITLMEGKNREIRRMTSHFRCPVSKLKRVQYGSFTLDKLAPGEFKEISKSEVLDAFPGVKLRLSKSS